MRRFDLPDRAALASLLICGGLAACQGPRDEREMGLLDPSPADFIAESVAMTPVPPWPPGDDRGMSNTLGPGTWLRCAHHLAQPGARAYELSHIRSNNMSQSPWGPPMRFEYRPTAGVPGTIDAWHPGDAVTGEPGAQGTQMDALAHWGFLPEPWDGIGQFPADDVVYYGGFTQAEVKPTPDSPLVRLGIDRVPPLVTSAVLLDAKSYLGQGQPMEGGQLITANDMEQMLLRQGLASRGLLPGDVVYVRTGWGEYWGEDFYYDMGPGLSYDAAQYLQEKNVVLVALDNPFTDAVNKGQFFDAAAPPEVVPVRSSTPVHYHNLTQAGIHNIQNAQLTELANDKVWISCTMILPLRIEGGSGSPVRPIAIGTAWQGQ